MLNMPWSRITRQDLDIERQQLRDEGRDQRRLSSRFRTLGRQDFDRRTVRERAMTLLVDAQKLPTRPDYPFIEPSDLAGIRKERPRRRTPVRMRLSRRQLLDRLHGAWLGRCAGCLLGKPVEGIKSASLWGYLKETGQHPLNSYIRADAPKRVFERHAIPEFMRKRMPVPFTAGRMIEDDDTNYTVTGLAIVKKHGETFTPEDVATFWLESIPLMHLATAERVAYRNVALGIAPPESASYCNPYREWIGAQIRADFFGYVAVGDSRRAAQLAWRDASISHVKNGLYGAMWVAAMLAAAPALDDPADVVRAGLSQIPRRSRLAKAVGGVLAQKTAGVPAAAALADIHHRWDEHNPHHWCHTVSNAEIVAMALLYGNRDFGKSVCLAVQACFDTDCNGATVGSVAGMMLGAERLPSDWTSALNDTLETGVVGYRTAKISSLAAETLQLHRRLAEGTRR